MGLKDPKGIRIRDKGTTPSKTNMEPEHISWKQRNIYTNHQFFGVNLPGGILNRDTQTTN